MRPSLLLCVFCWLSCVSLKAQNAAPNLFDWEHSLRYAEYLENAALYDMAAQEYKHLLALRPADSLHVACLRNFRLANFPDSTLRHIAKNYDTTQLSGAVAKEYTWALAEKRNFEKIATTHYLSNNYDTTSKHQIQTCGHLLREDYAAAQNLSNAHQLTDLQALAEKGRRIKNRKVWVARLLSTIVPGSGKIYAGEWQDGLLSMVSIGLMGWQAQRGFEKRGAKSVYGWINASMGFTFYLGNIYGAGRSVRVKNAEKHLRIKTATKQLLNKQLFD